HVNWCCSSQLAEIEQICTAAGRKLIMLHIGRAGSEGEQVWNALVRGMGAAANAVRLGELPADEVSIALQALDLGIATSPWPLVGKSGTVAAMLDHGVHTLVTDDSYHLRRGLTPSPAPHPLLHRFDEAFKARLRSFSLSRQPSRPRNDMYLAFSEALEQRAAIRQSFSTATIGLGLESLTPR
ncbi:MAG: hypothetical protein JO005_02450, partial [Gammaproteobacteria bacterium]|nr:hypothetical protein [Gammaproteobacteria bacterium]